MDDASLNPTAGRASSPAATICGQIVQTARRAGSLAAGGDAGAARRRDHQPQLPRDASAARVRDPRARQGHRAARRSTAPPRRPPTSAPRPRSGSPRRWRRCSTTRRAIVTEFIEGAAMSAEELREPAALAEVAAALRAIHGCGEPLPSSFDSFRIVENYARDRARPRRRACPTPYERGARCARRDRGGARRARARARPLPQRPARGQLHLRDGERRAGSSTGSTPGWATATSTSPTSPSTTSSTRRGEEALLERLLRRAPAERRGSRRCG